METFLKESWKNKQVLGLSVIGTIFYVLSGFVLERTNFTFLFIIVSGAFITYYYIYKQHLSLGVALTIGIIFRTVYFNSIPVFSDDYFRFIWDGKMILEGVSPFEFLPSEYVENNSNKYLHYLVEKMNSPNYYSVYPPMSQLVYTLSALVDQPKYSIVIIRLFLIGADVIAFIFIRKILALFNKDKKIAILYFLNPLVIIEFAGNLHFEGLMVCFLVVSLYLLFTKKYILSSTIFALSIGVKLLPLMFLPLLFFRLKGLWKWLYPLVVGTIVVLLFIPFLDIALLQKMMESVNLYFQSFEFNASVYYILRWIGFKIYGYNTISMVGAGLGITNLLLILLISYFRRTKDLFTTLLAINSVYLLLSTTIHPWYLVMPLLFSVFTSYRYMVVWSLMVFLSYSRYQTSLYQENYYLVTLEYLMVIGYLFYEFSKLRRKLLTSDR